MKQPKLVFEALDEAQEINAREARIEELENEVVGLKRGVWCEMIFKQ